MRVLKGMSPWQESNRVHGVVVRVTYGSMLVAMCAVFFCWVFSPVSSMEDRHMDGSLLYRHIWPERRSLRFDGLHRRTPHMCEAKFNGSRVSQLLSYCITFLPEPDKHEQLPDIHDPFSASSKSYPQLLWRPKPAAHPPATKSSIHFPPEMTTAVDAFSLHPFQRTDRTGEKGHPSSLHAPFLSRPYICYSFRIRLSQTTPRPSNASS